MNTVRVLSSQEFSDLIKDLYKPEENQQLRFDATAFLNLLWPCRHLLLYEKAFLTVIALHWPPHVATYCYALIDAYYLWEWLHISEEEIIETLNRLVERRYLERYPETEVKTDGTFFVVRLCLP